MSSTTDVTQRPQSLLIFIVAYQAETTIEKVLQRVDAASISYPLKRIEVLIIDDSSRDRTFELASRWARKRDGLLVNVLKNPENLGYGGNQKLGFRYGIDNKFDLILLMHGDDQHFPETISQLIAKFTEGNGSPGLVIGSRMLDKTLAIEGGMPHYKFWGNRLLTAIQNALLGTSLSEFHSGFRLYSRVALESVPFEYNSDDFDFDTEIIIQLHSANYEIREVPVPTYYGNEVCRVNSIGYGLAVLRDCLLFNLQSFGIFFRTRFFLASDENPYLPKFDFCSTHKVALETIVGEDITYIVGCGPADIARPFVLKSNYCELLDLALSKEHDDLKVPCHSVNLETISQIPVQKDEVFSKVLMLDVIEHLSNPERALRLLRNTPNFKTSQFVFSTANVAFFLIRLSLLFGRFQYGARGILDITHKRLFTYDSFTQIIKDGGFRICSVHPIPAPFPLAIRNKLLSRLLLIANQIVNMIFPRAFAYQILIVAEPLPSISERLSNAEKNSQLLHQELD